MSIEKEVEHVGSLIRKHAKILIVVVFACLLIDNPLALSMLGIVNPGFPGAEASCYGATYLPAFANSHAYTAGWNGLGIIHPVGANEPSLANQSGGSGPFGWFSESYQEQWGAGSGPASMTIQESSSDTSQYAGLNVHQLSTEVQTQIPLANFNYQNSTPLQISNALPWDQGELLQYWNAQASATTSVKLSNGTVVNSTTYTATSNSLLLIPGNFYITLSIPPSQDNAVTNSHWQEGTWSNINLWYVIYWYEWLNAYGNVLKNGEVPPTIPANSLNRQDQFNIRGGFPLAGWIQGYEVPVQTSTGSFVDLYEFLTNGGKTYAGSQIDPNVVAKINLDPSLTGRQVTLYTQPSESYSLPLWTLPSGSIDQDPNFASSQGLSQSPDFQTVLPAEYFKIGLKSFGTYSKGDPLGGYTVYYPTVSYLMRFIFAVYGVHTFTWTVQTAQNLGYNATQNYQVPPATWENRTTIITTTPGLASGLLDWFNNPWNDLQFWLMIGVIVILLVTVLNPGVWANVLHKRGED